MKIGGLSLKEDMERLRIIREVIGDKDLMVDVNRAWDFRRLMEIIKIYQNLLDVYCLRVSFFGCVPLFHIFHGS